VSTIKARIWSSALAAVANPTGSSIARPESIWGPQRNGVFQNVYDSFHPPPRRADTYRNDIVEQRIGEWVSSCPSTEGGKNWPAMSYYHPGQPLDRRIEQSCMDFKTPKRSTKRRRRGREAAARRALL